jgi:hypothetical protein
LHNIFSLWQAGQLAHLKLLNGFAGSTTAGAIAYFVVRAKGLEPPHLAMPEPKSGASTNSATPAYEKLPFHKRREPLALKPRRGKGEAAEHAGDYIRRLSMLHVAPSLALK